MDQTLGRADPLNAGIAVRLMEALAAAGEREAAIRHAGVYTELVRAELDVGPDACVVEMLTELRRRRDASERRPAEVQLRGPEQPLRRRR